MRIFILKACYFTVRHSKCVLEHLYFPLLRQALGQLYLPFAYAISGIYLLMPLFLCALSILLALYLALFHYIYCKTLYSSYSSRIPFYSFSSVALIADISSNRSGSKFLHTLLLDIFLHVSFRRQFSHVSCRATISFFK